MWQKLKQHTHNFLRWSEKYSKTDMVYLAKGGFWLTSGQIIASISSFFLAITFANLLSKETYGAYRYLLSVASLLTIPTLSGINTAVLQAVAQNYEGSVMPAIRTRIRWGLLAGLGSLLVGIYYLVNDNEFLATSFFIITVFLPFTDPFTIYQSVLQGRGSFKKESLYRSLSSIVILIIMLVVLLTTKNLHLILLFYFTSWFGINYFFFWLTKRTITDIKQSHDVINYGKHLTAFGVLGEIAVQIDKILLFHLLGGIGVAMYAIAIAPVQQIRGLARVGQILIIPKASIVNLRIIRDNYWRKFFILLTALTSIVFIYIIIAPIFFRVFFPTYIEAVYLSQLFSLSLIGSVAILNISLMQSHKEKKSLYKQSIIVAIFQILSLSVGIIYAGVIGAVIAFIISRLVHAIYSTIQVLKLFKQVGEMD
ncbi:MAG: oligosaccharide flippase family protein [Candidatus Vogelbacteria bacterium]